MPEWQQRLKCIRQLKTMPKLTTYMDRQPKSKSMVDSQFSMKNKTKRQNKSKNKKNNRKTRIKIRKYKKQNLRAGIKGK